MERHVRRESYADDSNATTSDDEDEDYVSDYSPSSSSSSSSAKRRREPCVVTIECDGLFGVAQTLFVNARRGVTLANDTGKPPQQRKTLERGFSISAVFGFGEDASGTRETNANPNGRRANNDSSDVVVQPPGMEFVAASVALMRDGMALATSATGYGSSRTNLSGVYEEDEEEDEDDDSQQRNRKSAKSAVENYIAAMDWRKPETTRAAPWYEGSRARIAKMAHSRDGESLLCCTSAGGAYVVPIWELVRDANASPSIRVLASRGTKPASAIWWYRSLEPDRSDRVVAICVGVDGEVRAWDAKSGSPLGACVVGAKCSHAELVRGKSSQFLLISGLEGETWTLMLERTARVVKTSDEDKSKVETTTRVESLPDAAGSHGFAAHALQDEYGVRQGRRTVLSVQNENDGVVEEDGPATATSAIACIVDRRLLEIYDADAPSEPTATRALPAHTVAVHLTEDLIFALVREPVLGDTEDLSDIYSFTSSVHVLARRCESDDDDGRRCVTLQTFHVPRRAGVPKSFMPARAPERVDGKRTHLRGCMLVTTLGVFELKPKSDVATALRSFMSKTVIDRDAQREFTHWESVEKITRADVEDEPELDCDDKLKLVARVLEEDHMPVFVDAARQELKKQNFTRAKELFEKTGAPLKDFVSLSLEVWEASQALTNFQSASSSAYGGEVNMAWLKTAAAAHAHLHAWCEASNAIARDVASEMGGESISAQLQRLSVGKPLDGGSGGGVLPEQAVDDVVRVVVDAMRATKDDAVERELSIAARASIIALEAAKAVTSIVTSACEKENYSERVRTLFTLLLSSTSVIESLHMLGGITANAIRQREATANNTTGGAVKAWEAQPLVFWDPNVTFYVTATQPLESMYDITALLGLRNDAKESFEATPLEILYETLDEDELWQLAMMCVAAKTRGVRGAVHIEVSILLRLNDDPALKDTIRMMLSDDPKLYGWTLSKCLAYRKFDVAASTALLMGDHATGAMCHIAAIEQLAREGKTSESTLQAELEVGMETYVSRVSSVGLQARLIEDYVQSWRRRGLAADELERVLLDVLVSQGHAAAAMQMVLEREFDFTFSGRFVLDVAAQRVVDDEGKYSSENGSTIESLWSEIKGELTSEMHAANLVRTKPFTDAERAALERGDCWAFTCGHRLAEDDLRRAVDDAKKRLDMLDLPISSLVLASDYERRVCAVACPECVANAVEARVDASRAAAA